MWWSCHLMRCDCLCCVMSRDAMRCHVMCPAMVTLCVRSGSVTMCWSKVLVCTTTYYCVLQSTTPVLLCTTQYYNVLLQYYSVLQSTTPVLVCTAKYYSSTTLYYKVLLQCYSVLQSTTPVLLCTTEYYTVLQRTTPVLPCTTKYYSSTTLYCKVLFRYYSVLQCTTPVLLCTTKYYSSTTLYYETLFPMKHMKRHFQCAEQAMSTSNLTKYCACHAKCISWLIRVTYETSFRMRGASNVNLEPQQILRLPRKMNLMIDARLLWNVISNAQSKQCQPPTSANTVPATKSLSSRLQRKLSELLPPI